LENDEFRGVANLDYLKTVLDKKSSIDEIESGRPVETFYLEQPTQCFTPHLFSLIDAHGDVYPCCFLYDDNSAYTEREIERRKKHCLGSVKDGTSFGDIWIGDSYKRIRRALTVITPTHEDFTRCGECTRHCNHNRSLSQLFEEYERLRSANLQADVVLAKVLKDAVPGRQSVDADKIWL